MRQTPLLLSIGALLLASLLVAADKKGPPPMTVKVDSALRELVQMRRVVTGELRAVKRSRLATREAGVVAMLLVREGDFVKTGHVIAKLDRRRIELEATALSADRAVAVAALAEAEADLKLRDWQGEAFEKLAKKGSSFQKEIREAASARLVAQSKVSKAKSELTVLDAKQELLDQRLKDTEIRAPFDGAVVALVAQEGEWVDVGAAVVEVVSTGAIEAWIDVPERLLVNLKASEAAVEVSIPAAAVSLDVEGIRIVPSVNRETRTVSVVAKIPRSSETVRPGMTLHPGMTVSAWIPVGETAERLTIPKDAILRNETGFYVFVARDAGGMQRANQIAVDRLFRRGDRVVVNARGIAAGDLLVVEGNERLFTGAPLVVSKRAPKSTGGTKQD
ncbi:MAG: efflux RND transporter periplasmic adaptor subunit [Planctomycetota bacterium]